MLFEIERTEENGVFILNLKGVLDAASIKDFQDSIGEIYNLFNELHLDFANLQLIDSAGIGSIAQFLTKSRVNNKTVKIINIPIGIYEVFEILGLPEIFGPETFRISC